MKEKERSSLITSQGEQNKLSTYNYGFFDIKCFVDAEFSESPSAGWQFVKYCMRG
ncbi:MAG: hypothetical protein OIN87_09155 [Candidatus Methanoperedens sp.]|nr:hypothetical protein [Candidatus Methanoperedens sp.]